MTNSANVAYHGTLVADTVLTVEILDAEGTIEVINRSGTAEIYFTIAPGTGTPTVPTVAGNDTYVVPALVSSFTVDLGENQGATVSLISSGTPTFSVVGGSDR